MRHDALTYHRDFDESSLTVYLKLNILKVVCNQKGFVD